jgi:ABC-2 type transport system ATP-binding protein
MPAAVTVDDLRKSYGPSRPSRGIAFEIEQGEVFGLLGPNGAGKTTTVEILEGYRTRDGGSVTVLGDDPERPARLARSDRHRPPVVGDVREPDACGARLSSSPATSAARATSARCRPRRPRRRSATARVKTLSGGQKRRLDLALGLVGDPRSSSSTSRRRASTPRRDAPPGT